MIPSYEDRAFRTVITSNTITNSVTAAFKAANIWSGGCYSFGENNLSKIYVTASGRELRDCIDSVLGPRPHHQGYIIIASGDEPREPKGQMASGW